MQRPQVVSLFSGAGGLDIGLESAGFAVVTATDIDKDSIDTLLWNQQAGIVVGDDSNRRFLQGTRLLRADVSALSARELRPDGCIRAWVPDVLAGGPPCQPFSAAGKQLGLDDPRGPLFREFVRLTGELRPRLVLLENVRGIVTARGPAGEPGEVLRMIKEDFEGIGYATTFSLVNAADFGAPQRRVRLFMLATRCTVLPRFPNPTHAPEPVATLLERRDRWRTLGEFLATQPSPSEDDVVRPTPALARALACVAPGSGLKSAGAREETRPGGHWGYRQGTFIADPSVPARTVTASSTQDWIRLGDGSLRRLTLRECAGLQGFPEAWNFCGSRASQFRQVGNAVQVAVARALGTALREALRERTRARVRSAELPADIASAIDYTRREDRRNGRSRRLVRTASAANPSAARRLKGLGSQDYMT